MRAFSYPALLLLASIPAAVRADAKIEYVAGNPVLIPEAKDLPKEIQERRDTKQFWYVLGFGRDEDEAARDALKKARDVVADYLARQDPPFRWTPSVAYVKDHLATDKVKRMPEFDGVVKLEKSGRILERQAYVLPVRLSKGDFEDMMQRDRQFRLRQLQAQRDEVAEGRMLVLGKVTAFVVVCLLLVIGYIRLEERTKGYLTRWLAVSAVVLLGLVAAGLFLFG